MGAAPTNVVGQGTGEIRIISTMRHVDINNNMDDDLQRKKVGGRIKEQERPHRALVIVAVIFCWGEQIADDPLRWELQGGQSEQVWGMFGRIIDEGICTRGLIIH
mmetsp:Transcript_16253/g.22295  ORF Transcript_16253/g.22295 Transcript_16253/m.22295 type:complete len:105 (-) Transcript_16253:170-484(-)